MKPLFAVALSFVFASVVFAAEPIGAPLSFQVVKKIVDPTAFKVTEDVTLKFRKDVSLSYRPQPGIAFTAYDNGKATTEYAIGNESSLRLSNKRGEMLPSYFTSF